MPRCFLSLLCFILRRPNVCFCFYPRLSFQERWCISISVLKTPAGRSVSFSLQYRANVQQKLWRAFKPTAKHGALMARSRLEMTFIPGPTGCGMKNSLRRGEAGRNRHFSRDFLFGESKVSRTHTCHGCTLLTNISRC